MTILEVKDQYYFNIKLGSSEGFLRESELEEFVYSREAGGGLPQFLLKFNTNQVAIFKYLNEGNTIEIDFGKSKKDSKIRKLCIAGDPEVIKVGNDSYSIAVVGFLDVPNYFAINSKITAKGNAASTLKKEAESLGFLWDSNNISTSNDEQNWIKFNTSNRRFFSDLVFHTWLDKSFPVWAIDGTGTLRYYDFDKLLSKNAKWNFTKRVQKSSDIVFGSDFVFLNEKSAITNFWYGYLSDQPVLDLVEGSTSINQEDVKSLLAFSDKLVRKASEEVRLEPLRTQTDYQHKNYWRAFQKNLKSNLLYSKHRIGLGFSNMFRPIEPLDLVTFQELELGNDNLTNTILSGNYICTKVVETIANRQYHTYVELARESVNNPKGTF